MKLVFSCRRLVGVFARRKWSSGSFCVHPEVSRAVQAGDPVVALETTIVTHGMPRPQNLETALAVEEEVRSAGAVPATIGLLGGTVHVGLTRSQLERLSSSSSVQKISQRDLAYCISTGESGGTTVSGTIMCAHKAGIPVFVTGGIGGVHRGGENTLDISADLATLGRTPVAVVCSGIKSILDIGRTLEYLETQGVPVLTLGQEKMFPSFFTAESEHESPFSVESVREAAGVVMSGLDFGVGSGVVLAVPPPPLTHPSSTSGWGQEVERAIQAALKEAKEGGICGKEVTPFVLKRVNELTGGKSLTVNVELIKNNARVGAEMAVEVSRLRRAGKRSSSRVEKCSNKKQMVVLGASILDFTAKIRTTQILPMGTNPGALSISFGGVARNIAECMSRLGVSPLLISAVGNDQNGKMLCDHLTECGVPSTGLLMADHTPTACYNLVLDHSGEVYCAIGDMDITNLISPDWVQRFAADIQNAQYVCVDGNIPEETLQFVLELCSAAKVPVWFEPTCILKACKPFLMNSQGQLTATSPNLQELRYMHHCLTSSVPVDSTFFTHTPATELSLDEKLSECLQLVRPLACHIPTIVISLGCDGILYCSSQGDPDLLRCLHYPAAAHDMLPAKVLSVSGAGDSFVGSMLAGIHSGLTSDLSIKAGLHAAFLSLKCTTAVSSELTPRLLQEENIKKWAPWTATEINL